MASTDFILGGANDSFDLFGKTIEECLSQRVLVLNQEINDDIIELYIIQILNWNMEDKNLPINKRKPIRIIVNSPGGDLIVGMGLVDAIMQSKTKVIAIGIGLVASAAFHIYISCEERIAFSNTIFLMHDGEISIQNSTSKARDTMSFFEKMENKTKNHVLTRTTMSEEYYDSHYDQELYMYAEQAKEFGCTDKIIGIDVDIDCLFD